MPFLRAYLSHNKLEWWNGHLATALALDLEVIHVPVARGNQPGHPPETDITRLLAAPPGQGGGAFYLGSVDQMFTGLSDLSIPTGIWTDFHLPSNMRFLPCLRLFDVVFSTGRNAVPIIEGAGVRQVEWLPFGFDTTLENDPDAEKAFDVGFVGSLDLPATRDERRVLLSALERRFRINDYRTPVFGDGMMDVYNRSKIVVNIPVPGGFNMRTFEAMASGALLLTKAVGNGQEVLFKEGVHLATYRDEADLLGKVDYYLRNESERRDIAFAGRTEVLSKHTYAHRAARVLEIMSNAARCRSTDPAVAAAAYAAYYSHIGRADLMAELAFARRVPPGLRISLLARACKRVAARVRGGRAARA
jgi:glycosyltransferase involved in cell wall biosynthesis